MESKNEKMKNTIEILDKGKFYIILKILQKILKIYFNFNL